MNKLIIKHSEESLPLYEKRKDYLIDEELSKIRYYHIFDSDIGSYLHTGLNSETRRVCLEAYMKYRSSDIYNWSDNFKTYGEFVKSLSDKDICDDMDTSCFHIEETLEKLQHDLFYIKNRSLGLDLSIILKTIKTVISQKGH